MAMMHMRLNILQMFYMLLLVCTSAFWMSHAQASDVTSRFEGLREQFADGPVTVTVQVDHDRVLVAQPFQLRIEAVAPRGVEVRLPEAQGRIGTFDVLAMRQNPGVPENGQRRWTQVYELESLRTGDLAIPSITLVYTDMRDAQNVDAGELQTPALPIQVMSVLEQESHPLAYRDIKGIVALPESPESFFDKPVNRWALIGTLVGVALLLTVGALLLRKRVVQLSPAQVAMESLAELERQICEDVSSDASWHERYYRLTDIVRTYLENQFDLPATRQTSPEFLARVRASGVLPETSCEQLNVLLASADLVKYAHARSSSDAVDQAIADARTLVAQTSQAADQADADITQMKEVRE